MPILGDIGKEVWKVNETLVCEEEVPQWGEQLESGPLWGASTAYVYLLAGADILVMRHPLAVRETKEYINKMVSSE